jgi:DNA-binding IclR family transcriptional regulator
LAALIEVLRALSELGVAGPGDLVASTRLPRYRVLAIVKCLEELGLIEAIYVKGSYKVYRVSIIGTKLLESVASGASLREIIEHAIVESARTPSSISGVSGVGVTGEAEAG